MSGGPFQGALSDLFLAAAFLAGCGSSTENTSARSPESTPAIELVRMLRDFTVPCPSARTAAPASAPAPPPPPPPPAPSVTASVPRDSVFVEMLILEAPSRLVSESAVSLANLEQLASQPEVRMLSTPHAVIDFVDASGLRADESAPVQPKVSLNGWSLGARRAEGGVTVLDLELDLPAQRAANAASPLRLSVSSRADQSGLARIEWDHAARRSFLIVFRQHAVHGENDLREIFECKMWRARHASAS